MAEQVRGKKHDQQDGDGEQACRAPGGSPFTVRSGRHFAWRLQQFNVDRALLPPRAQLHLKGDTLRRLRANMQALACLDMEEDLLPALGRFNEAKAPFVVPGLNGAFKSHDEWITWK
ncbi:hypothetical protein D3C78_1488930 [compost metagenome]